MSYTKNALKVLKLAQQEVKNWQHDFVGTEHLLLAILQCPECSAYQHLTKLIVDVDRIRKQIDNLVAKGHVLPVHPKDHTYSCTPSAKNALRVAEEQADLDARDKTSTTHILLGLLHQEGRIAATVLRTMGIRCDRLSNRQMSIAKAEVVH